jgi:two-component system chemotaxis response regulator CheY
VPNDSFEDEKQGRSRLERMTAAEVHGDQPEFVRQRENTMKSLVAEDDATNRKLLKTFLSRYGECDIAVDGNEAVNAVLHAIQSGREYDLVCMDLRMPKVDGQEAIREIRREEAANHVAKTARIIVTTVHTDTESIAAALLGRCDAYLVKPIDTAKLKKELIALGLIQ